ncbi:MAG: hypothetical protein JO116_22755 [Planctomycetaceae bacterium]|nr:hypothetical protein [Planctomycetaceae bacterium]
MENISQVRLRNQGGVVMFEVYDPEDPSGPRGRFLSLTDAGRAVAFRAESRGLDRAAARPARVGAEVATVEHPGDGSLGGVVWRPWRPGPP